MLHVRLLGTLELQAGDDLVPPPDSRRACELLAWLALHPGEHPRAIVAATFWPGVLDTSARASLRSAVWAARKALGDAGSALIGTRDRVGLRCTTDVQRFDELLEHDRLEEAVALCRGPLLADFDDDWILEARDRHVDRLGAALTRLADAAPTPAAAVEYARRRLVLDPLGEDATRDLMQRLSAAGDRSGALALYDRFSDRLRTQLATAPSARTRQLAGTLRDPPRDDDRLGQQPSAAPARSLPLVGRDAELTELIAATVPGRRTIAVLAGEVGIGKTRLAVELLARSAATGARTASCTALALGDPAPLAIWAELLCELARTIPAPPEHARWPDELAAVAASLPMRLGRTAAQPTAPALATPELARARLFEAVIDLLEHACADRPLTLLFEDLHAADAESLELLSYALGRIDRLPIATVLTRREGPVHASLDALLHAHRARGGTVTEIALEPLSRPDVDMLVRQVVELDPAARDRVTGDAEGNPLLVVESARAAAAGLPGPASSLHAVVTAALGPLSPPARRVVELVAVAGRPLAHAELDALGALGARPLDTVQALQSGLLATDRAGVGFRRRLLLDAALARLPEPRRRALHAELAATVIGPAAEVARHLREAGQADALALVVAADAIVFLPGALALSSADAALLDAAHVCDELRPRTEDASAVALRRLDPAQRATGGAAHLLAGRWHAGAVRWPHGIGQEAMYLVVVPVRGRLGGTGRPTLGSVELERVTRDDGTRSGVQEAHRLDADPAVATAAPRAPG